MCFIECQKIDTFVMARKVEVLFCTHVDDPIKSVDSRSLINVFICH